MNPRRLLAFPLILALSLAPLQAVADGMQRAPLSSSLAGDAKAAYDGANLLFNDNDFAGAATKYRAAMKLAGDPRLLWNIAACEKELRHYARASVLVDQFLREASALVPSDVVAQAKAVQGALLQFFSPVRFNIEPEGARVLLDGDEIGLAPLASALPVDLGKHVVRVELEGYVPSETRIEVGVEKDLSVAVSLKANAVVSLPVVLAPAAAPSTAPPSGTLTVVAPQDDDVVSVDGKVVGGGRWEGALSPGLHHLLVTGRGERPYARDVELAIGAHRSITVPMQAVAKGRALWPWLVGGAAVVAAGVVGTYFGVKAGEKTTVVGPPIGTAGSVQLQGVWR